MVCYTQLHLLKAYIINKDNNYFRIKFVPSPILKNLMYQKSRYMFLMNQNQDLTLNK